jgi:butyryl-CoA dehydrogenase
MRAPPANPLIDDRTVDFLLYDVFDVPALCQLPAFADHGRETFELVLGSVRRLAREVLYPLYRPMDQAPPVFEAGAVRAHPGLVRAFPQLVELGMIAASRPYAVGGQQLPLTLTAMASAYLMAANLSAYGYIGLTAGAAHLIEAFGSDELKRDYMARMYRGEWLGTMALTEPQAGSSLADVASRATPRDDGSYSIKGNKIFISGGDHDLCDNIVHMVLARLRGAPAGIKGVSLFLVPKRRLEAGALVDNDIAVAGVIHKIGWRGLPSLALAFGERDDCRGWLVGEPHGGIAHMFQMMNEARIMVGMNGVATASVAYHASLAYARERAQGRPLASKDPRAPQVPLVHHADVRRMLLRQKAIVEGGLALLVRTSYYADLAEHAADGAQRRRAALVLDLLTPVAKSFPAERGFEANTLALQVHGGYGYSSEYLAEAWLRDQKLNSIHEGTTGIQSIDLLGRRVLAGDGAALVAFAEEVRDTLTGARAAGLDTTWTDAVDRAVGMICDLTAELAGRGRSQGPEALLLHSVDYLELVATTAVAWQWVAIAAAVVRAARTRGWTSFDRAKLAAAQYWIHTELPRVDHLVALCRSGESSYGELDPAWL